MQFNIFLGPLFVYITFKNDYKKILVNFFKTFDALKFIKFNH